MKGSTNAQTIGGTVGSDTKPVKVVGGIATAVTYDLIQNRVIGTSYATINSTNWDVNNSFIAYERIGPIVHVVWQLVSSLASWSTYQQIPITTNMPKPTVATYAEVASDNPSLAAGYLNLAVNGSMIYATRGASGTPFPIRGSFVYFTTE